MRPHQRTYGILTHPRLKEPLVPVRRKGGSSIFFCTECGVTHRHGEVEGIEARGSHCLATKDATPVYHLITMAEDGDPITIHEGTLVWAAVEYAAALLEGVCEFLDEIGAQAPDIQKPLKKAAKILKPVYSEFGCPMDRLVEEEEERLRKPEEEVA